MNAWRFTAVAAVVLWCGCVFPADRSEHIVLELSGIPPTLFVGDSVVVQAVVREEGGRAVRNVQVLFGSTANAAGQPIFEGRPLPPCAGETTCQRVLVIAIDTGSAEIFASAPSHTATFVSVPVEVRGGLAIDSVAPRTVRYGDTVSVYGVGLDTSRLLSAVAGSVVLPYRSFTPADLAHPERFARLAVWIPAGAPASTTLRLFSRLGGSVESRDSLTVIPLDVYEPNDTAPADLGLLTGTFFNPALAFERRPAFDTTRVDWYRVTVPAGGGFTVAAKGLGNDQLSVWDGSPLAPGAQLLGAWQAGFRAVLCRGPLPLYEVTSRAFDAAATSFAFRAPAGGVHDLYFVYARAGKDRSYELTIDPAYRAALPPDAFESNDTCEAAAPITLPQSASLTIDRPGDFDWFRFTLGSPGDSVVVSVVSAEPNDLDVVLYRDFLPDSLNLFVCMCTENPSGERARGFLPPGSYLALVFSFIDEPVAYSATVAPVTSGAVRARPAPLGAIPLFTKTGRASSRRPSGSR